jgi:hypothetical protein
MYSRTFAFWMLCLICISSTMLVTNNCLASDAHYCLDTLAGHPYRFPPVYGHAAQMPGSPKYFVPGYGYRIPGFGFRAGYSETLNSYADYYDFGRRVPQFYNDTKQRYWDNGQGGPWYYPGASNNTRTAWPDW